MIGGAGREGSFRAVLHNRPFLYLWIAQILSQLTQNIISFALVVEAGSLAAGSGTATAGVIVAFSLPAILFSAVAGVYVDRQPKRQVLVGANVLRGLIVLAYMIPTMLPGLGSGWQLAILYATTLLFASASQFFIPAEAATIPLLVAEDDLVAANGLFNLTFTAAQLIGFAFLGPVLVGIVGDFGGLFAGFAGIFVLCAYLCRLLPARETVQAHVAGETARARLAATWAELREGWTFIRADPALKMAILYWAVALSTLMMLATIGNNFLTTVLHVNPQHLYFVMVPGGAGLVAGVLLVARVATPANQTRLMNRGLFGAAAGLLILGLAHGTLGLGARLLGQPEPPIALTQVIIGVVAFGLGLVNSFITVPAQTVLQEHAPPAIRARVFSAFYTISNAILIVPLLLAGGLTDFIGVVQTIVLIAGLVFLVALVGPRLAAGAAEPEPVPAAGGATRAEE